MLCSGLYFTSLSCSTAKKMTPFSTFFIIHFIQFDKNTLVETMSAAKRGLTIFILGICSKYMYVNLDSCHNRKLQATVSISTAGIATLHLLQYSNIPRCLIVG